jgi:hypothetical protein
VKKRYSAYSVGDNSTTSNNTLKNGSTMKLIHVQKDDSDSTNKQVSSSHKIKWKKFQSCFAKYIYEHVPNILMESMKIYFTHTNECNFKRLRNLLFLGKKNKSYGHFLRKNWTGQVWSSLC